jgi:hypothetical protein
LTEIRLHCPSPRAGVLVDAPRVKQPIGNKETTAIEDPSYLSAIVVPQRWFDRLIVTFPGIPPRALLIPKTTQICYGYNNRSTRMKNLILATTVAVMVPGLATSAVARLSLLGNGIAIIAKDPQQSGTITRLTMGPTSAPQKPGGVGEGPSEKPKVHKKTVRKYRTS